MSQQIVQTKNENEESLIIKFIHMGLDGRNLIFFSFIISELTFRFLDVDNF